MVGCKLIITLQLKVLYMENKNYQEDLQHIRKMMERSSRFISLNGLSGVFAGVFALLGAAYVYFLFLKQGVDYFNAEVRYVNSWLLLQMIQVAILVMVLAIGFAIYLTIQKSSRKGLSIWDSSTKNLLIHFSVPLFTGGIFCLALIYHQLFVFLGPSTLIFYGLALFSAGNYTFSDIKYLGLCEIVLGIASLFFLGYGLFFWAIGFGVMHIVYGLIMHKKYK